MIRRLLILLALAAGVYAIALAPAIRAKRTDEGVKTLLLAVQRAMQDYHVEEEIYPATTPMSGSSLISLLVDQGYLEEAPHNPWSGQRWELPDDPIDWLVYETDGLAESYALIAYRSEAKERVHHTLDSSANQSLEE